MNNNTNYIIQVAAGVVVNSSGDILLAKRPLDKHQGGLWEFPGGKMEPGESTRDALARELEEEVGVTVVASEPLIRIQYSYPDKNVCLEVLRVENYSGEAWGREGQEIAWVPPAGLTQLPFPAANKPIVAAARLPRRLMITGAFESETEFLELLRQGLNRRVGMVQFRAPWLDQKDYIHLARQAHSLCQSLDVPLIANCSVDTFQHVHCDGLHLTSDRCGQIKTRPVDQSVWLSTACHNLAEIQQAQTINADFVSLSPVQTTETHVGFAGMGWEKFEQIVAQAELPVYALGGMREKDLALATASGAQGIAALGAFWKS